VGGDHVQDALEGGGGSDWREGGREGEVSMIKLRTNHTVQRVDEVVFSSEHDSETELGVGGDDV